MKILLADDSPDTLASLTQYLTMRGHAVTEAANGAEALKALRHQPYDAMITDLVMPQVNGVELVEQAREMGRLPPTMMLTGKDPEWASIVGVIKVLEKPADPEEIERELVKMVHAEA